MKIHERAFCKRGYEYINRQIQELRLPSLLGGTMVVLGRLDSYRSNHWSRVRTETVLIQEGGE